MSDATVVPLLHQILDRLSAIEGKLNGGASSGSASAGSAAEAPKVPPSVAAFDEYCTTFLNPFVAACKKLGGDAEAAGNNIGEAWAEMRIILTMATACKEPTQAQIGTVFANLSAKLKAQSNLVKRNEWEKHTKTCSEGVGCLNWLLVKPAPRDFIESFVGGSDYWANNIRKEHRTTNPDQIAFCDTFKNLLLELMSYVKAHHATGLSWNSKGGDPTQYKAGAPVAAAAAAAAAPVATAAPVAVAAKAEASSAAVPKVDLFSALNKEGGVTSGLKKVTKEMQTWRSEYKTDAPPAPVAAKAAPAPKSNANQVKGPPKFEFLEGNNKWVVENQTDAAGKIDIEIKDKKETVYIFGCAGATIDIKGKCKSIVVDGCKKTNVYFDVAMASCEVVNCLRMNIHCRETVSAVAIDKTDGIVVHLPVTSLTTEIVASKSSEMNLSWPDANGDIIEKPIPEQYVHRIKGNGVSAEVSDLYTH